MCCLPWVGGATNNVARYCTVCSNLRNEKSDGSQSGGKHRVEGLFRQVILEGFYTCVVDKVGIKFCDKILPRLSDGVTESYRILRSYAKASLLNVVDRLEGRCEGIWSGTSF